MTKIKEIIKKEQLLLGYLYGYPLYVETNKRLEKGEIKIIKKSFEKMVKDSKWVEEDYELAKKCGIPIKVVSFY